MEVSQDSVQCNEQLAQHIVWSGCVRCPSPASCQPGVQGSCSNKPGHHLDAIHVSVEHQYWSSHFMHHLEVSAVPTPSWRTPRRAAVTCKLPNADMEWKYFFSLIGCEYNASVHQSAQHFKFSLVTGLEVLLPCPSRPVL